MQKSKNSDGVFINQEVNNEKMKTITGKEIDFQKVGLLLGSEEYGYAAAKPSAWKDVSDDQININTKGNCSYIGYVPKDAVDELLNTDMESLSADEHIAVYDKYYAQIVPIACVYAENNEKSKEADYMIPEGYDKTECITESNGNTYYIAYNTDISPDNDNNTLSDNDKEMLKSMMGGIEDLKNNVLLFPAGKAEGNNEFKGSLTTFNAEDMDGKKVDQSIFSNYDLTMVNIWTTWCGVCVEEMPYLEKLHQKLPDNVNIISICGDANDEKELAQQILDKNEITFQTLIGNDSLQESLLKYVSGFPTTIFVDKNGNIVGDIQMGAPGEDIVEGYQTLIDKRLSEITQK
ncbi:MAG: TlpA disulfide reductase family protein [Peptococcaceae bacterium]|nr:TlpA disulfide reductase family protein [Peptococcaceae bacterium]